MDEETAQLAIKLTLVSKAVLYLLYNTISKNMYEMHTAEFPSWRMVNESN